MLYFLPTPIGNLGDISARCLDILKQADIVICEDTRVGKSLLNLLHISLKSKEFYSINSHTFLKFSQNFNFNLLRDKICVYISDAGMPCISDPGSELVKFAQDNNYDYEVLPGANAALLAVAASGFLHKEFTFFGFLPNTGSKREIALQTALNSPFVAIIYEAPTRILALVETIAKYQANREIFLIKEATKKFEKKFFGQACKIAKQLQNENLSGEWVLVLSAKENITYEGISQDDILSLEIAPKIKAKLLSKINGDSIKKNYENIIK